MSPPIAARARLGLSLAVIAAAISVASCGASHEAEPEADPSERDAEVEALDASASADATSPTVRADGASQPVEAASEDAGPQADAAATPPAETRRHKCALVLRECNTGYYSSPSCPEFEPLPGASCSEAQRQERMVCYYCDPGQEVLTPKYYSGPYTVWSCSGGGVIQASQTACIVG